MKTHTTNNIARMHFESLMIMKRIKHKSPYIQDISLARNSSTTYKRYLHHMGLWDTYSMVYRK